MGYFRMKTRFIFALKYRVCSVDIFLTFMYSLGLLKNIDDCPPLLVSTHSSTIGQNDRVGRNKTRSCPLTQNLWFGFYENLWTRGERARQGGRRALRQLIVNVTEGMSWWKDAGLILVYCTRTMRKVAKNKKHDIFYH